MATRPGAPRFDGVSRAAVVRVLLLEQGEDMLGAVSGPERQGMVVLLIERHFSSTPVGSLDPHRSDGAGAAPAFPGVWAARAISPAPVDRRTIMVIGTDEIVALDAPSLRERWRAARVHSYDAIGQERAAGPHVLMQVGTLGVLVRDVATGRERWRREARSPAHAPSVVDSHRVYFHDLRHEVIALDVKDGAERWRQALPGKVWDAHWRLILVGDHVAAVGPETLLFDRASGRLVARFLWVEDKERSGGVFSAESARCVLMPSEMRLFEKVPSVALRPKKESGIARPYKTLALLICRRPRAS